MWSGQKASTTDRKPGCSASHWSRGTCVNREVKSRVGSSLGTSLGWAGDQATIHNGQKEVDPNQAG